MIPFDDLHRYLTAFENKIKMISQEINSPETSVEKKGELAFEYYKMTQVWIKIEDAIEGVLSFLNEDDV